MTTFGAMNDSYYEPPHDRAWDAFVDYCDAEDLNVEEEDFEAWVEEQHDRAADAAAERAMDYAREDAWDREDY